MNTPLRESCIPQLSAFFQVEESAPFIVLREAFLTKLNAYLVETSSNPYLDRKDLAQCLGMSENELGQHTLAYLGCGLKRYVIRFRLKLALDLMKVKRYDTISEVCYAVGFRSKSDFLKGFKKEFNKLPDEVLNQGG